MADLWKSAKSARAAMEADVEALLMAFEHSNKKHVRSWLTLTPGERRDLLVNPFRRSGRWPASIAEAVANSAYQAIRATPKRAADALTIFDDLIELPAKSQVDCWKNALWAVMPGNSGLPLDREKCLHYLKRSLPHTAKPGLLWNVACVHKELGDIDACIKALEKAKAQGDDMKGPRDEPFFWELWGNEGFDAVFEGMAPTHYELDETQTLDAIPDPARVLDLELRVIKKIPEKLREFVNLETLDLSGSFKTVPLWLADFSKLKTLELSCWGVRKIPDAIVCMPSLEALECTGALPEGYDRIPLNQLIKSFRKNDVPADARPVHLRLLVGQLPKKTSDAQVVEALGSTATKVHRAALNELAKRWSKRTCELSEGAEVVVVGRLAGDRSVLKERLERLGVVSKKKAGPKTVAIIVGPRHGGKACAFVGGDVPLFLESHLLDELDRKDKRHLDASAGGTDDDAGEMAAQLSELLLSVDQANAKLALEMIKRGGLPAGLLEELFLAWQTQDFSTSVRKTAKTLFERYAAPETLEVVRTELSRTNIFGSGETKLARRLAAIDKKSGGELSGVKIARVMFARNRDGLKYLLKNTKKGDDTFELLKTVRQGDALELSGMELTRIPDDVARLEGLASLSARANHIGKLTAGLFQLESLREIEMSHNRLSALPDEIKQLSALRKLELASNYFRSFPKALLSLTELEHLDFSSENYSEKMKMKALGQDLSPMVGLKHLELQSHAFEELPESIKMLPKLETLEIGWGSLPVIPAWLLKMPSLKELDIQYIKLADGAASSKVLKALEEKGVKVQH